MSTPLPKRSGPLVVSAFVAFTCVAVGVGTIYLPFIADKDALRGMDENNDKIMKKRMEEMMAEQRRERERLQQQEESKSNKQPPRSMWSVLSARSSSVEHQKGSEQ